MGFKVRVFAVITAISGTNILVCATKHNHDSLPTMDIGVPYHGDPLNAAEMLFTDITGLNPKWAALSLGKININDDVVEFFYRSRLSEHDELLQGYEWYSDISKVNCGGVNPRSIIYV